MTDFPSTIDLSSPGTNGDSIGGGEAGDYAGWSVASAGDVDGDGLCDILIGAPSGGAGAGRVYLIFGRAGGIGTLDLGALTADRGLVIAGAAAGDLTGWSVAAAGDLNHDGKADFIIGARLADAGGGEDSGRAWLIFGGAGLAGPIDLAALDPGRGFAIDSGAGFDHAGWSVAAAGDVNHDGIDDLLIGVPGADGAGIDRGAAFVIFGHDGGFGDVDLAALAPGQGFAIAGCADYDEAGRSLAAAGDVNGDGFDDVIVGAAHAGFYAGAAWVVFGRAGGPGAVDLGALAPEQGFAISGAGGEQAGFSVACAGDVNGDGFGDLIVGAPYAEAGAGRAYVIFGHGGPFAAIDLANLSPAEGFAITGAAAGDHSGWSVAGGGDLNGDGFDDLVIGAPYAENGGGTDRGAAYVILGHNGNFEAIDLAAIPAAQGLVIRGESDYDQLGRSVAFSGDINNDGLDDLLVGAPYSGAGDSGGAYVIYGCSRFGGLPMPAFTPGNIVVYRVGTGVGALGNAATAVFLDEYTPAGVLVQSVALPTADSGANQTLTASGTATNEGMLTRSADGHYLILTGYDAAVGTAAVAGTSTTGGTPVLRVIGRVDASGGIDTTTTTTSFSGAGIRSAASTDGTVFWADGAATGVIYAALGGSGAGTLVSSTATNLRSIGIFDGQLYVGSGAGSIRMGIVGSNLPTTSGQTITSLPGFPTATNLTNQFYFADLTASVAGVDTLYVADDRAVGASGGGLLKFSLVGGSWVSNGVASGGLTTGLRGLTGSTSGISVTFYATDAAATTHIVSLIDTGGYNAAFSTTTFATIATAAANTAFRGIAFAPTPPGAETQTVQFNPTSVTLNEGNTGTTAYTFTVTRTGGTTGQLNFSGTIAAGTTNNADYVGGTAPTTFSGSILAGQTSATVTVNVQGDYTIEPNEAFTLTLTSVSNTDGTVTANIGLNLTGTGNITNDDAAGALSVANVSIAEGDSGTTAGSFTVTRSGGATGTVTVDYVITLPGGVGGADGSDVSGPLTGTVTFIEGQTSASIPFSINGDLTIEPDETFTVALSNATGGASISGPSATATILNDDSPPVITIGDASLVEGDNGVTYLVFTVSLSKTWVDPVTVDYDTSGVTATEDVDYLGIDGQVTFAPGVTAQTIRVPIVGDETPENNETLLVTLSNPTNATIGDGLATGTITNDDGALYYSLAGGSFSQNWTNTGQITTDDVWSGVPYIVGYRGDDLTASTGTDARTLFGTSNVVDVNANQTNPAGFATGGVAEFFKVDAADNVDLENPTVAIQGSGTADAPYLVLFMDSTGRSNVRLQANLRDLDTSSDDAAQQINVQYRTSPSGPWINVPGAYFADVTSQGTATQVTALDVVLPAGADNSASLEIRIMTTNAVGNDEWVGIDDIVVSSQQSAPSLSIANAAVFEGDSGPTVISFTVTRAGSSVGAVTADYAVAFGGGPFDANAADFSGALSGQVSFADGQTSATITLDVNGDTGPEGDENFTVTLSNPSLGATIADGSATGTIVNDDGPPPLVSINNVTVTEGDSGFALMTFTVTRTGGTGAFDVNWETADQTAIAPGDYTGTSGTIHFANGQMTDTVTVVVSVNGDTDPELSETFRVLLTNPTNFAIVTDGEGIGTIASDDPIFIHDIQGTAYFSPILALEGITSFNTASTATVIVRAIVTAVDNDGPRQGFYLQEEISDWDGNNFTSEGIFVFTGSTVSGVAVGDLVTVTAHVMEYQGFSSNMPVTTLTSPSSITVQTSGNTLPTLLLDGVNHPMPSAIMTLVQPDYTDSSDGVGDTFDASLYALSFWETVEGMLVTIPNMVVADGFVATPGGGLTFQAYSQDHADADQINARGGYTIAGDPPIGPPDTGTTEDDTISGGRHLSDGDVNPDIIEVDFTGFAIDAPAGLANSASMGDYLGSITGIVDFDFTDRKLFVTSIDSGSFIDHTTTQDVTVLGDDTRSLTVATFNVENLDPGDPLSKFQGLAAAIANNLNAPDIISIEEIQDNNGATASGGADASVTWQMLVDALNTLTGAHYQWVDQEPNGSEGGEPGGNIRVGFLYNTDRVQLGDLDANATLAERRMYTDRIGDGVRDAGDLIQFSDDMLGAEIQTSDWSNTRRSLLGEFTFNGNRVYVTANHFPAKGGSDDFWEFNQDPANGEPTNSGWTQRNNVAQDVYAMLNLIESGAPGSGIVSGGDYNDFYFYRPLTTVTGYTMADGSARIGGARFDNLTLTLPMNERYTYNFDGRSQAIDHIVVNATLSAVASYDVVHLNTGFNTSDPTPLSDHDPGLSSFDFRNFSETLRADAGNDAIDGFGGTDTIVYGGAASIVESIGGWTVDDGSGTDTLTNVEIVDDSAPGVILLVGNGGFATIQDAIDAASGGDTIIVASGTYNESIIVDKDVTIEGANAGTAGTGTRGAETVITGNVTVSAAGVTIDGVEITGAAADALGTTGVVVQGGANNFSLVNSVLNGTGDLGMIVGLVTGLDVGDNLIEGYSNGIYVAGGSTTGSVHGNSFLGDGQTNGTGLINGLLSETTHVTISGNAFDALDGGSLFLFPSGPDTVDLDSYISGNTITNSGAARPVQILPTNLTHNVIGTDFNEAFDGETAALAGVTGAFTFDGQGGDDRAWGGGANDTFTGGAGNELLFGNGGTDTAVYAGNRADYTAVATTNGSGVVTGFSSVTDNNPTGLNEGTDTLTSIERLQFADATLDLGQRVQLFDGAGQLVGTFNDIQAAIDAAANGYRIEAQAGTYNESLNVDVDVTIEGANAGTAGTGSRGAETVITGNVTVSAAGVTIDGVEITGAAADALGTTGVVVQGGANNFSLVNSVLNGTGDLGMIVGLVTGLDVGDNLIEGYSNGIYVSGGSTTGSVHDNSFLGDGQTNGTGLINGLLSETTHVTISGNAFDALDGGSLFLFPSGPDTVDLDSYISGNTITNSGADRPVQILPTNLTHNVIGTDFNDAFDGETAALAGVTGSFSFDGQGGDDRAWGGQAGDTFTGGAGNELLFGNGGTDTAVYAGNRADYTVVATTNGAGVVTGFTSVTDNNPTGLDEGTDMLTSIERLQFADATLDLGQRVQLFDGSGNLVGTFNDIQDAIDAASNGYRIEAQAGTYNETLTVDKDVTIEGANAGTAGTAVRGSETVITGQITIAAAGVTIDGVSVTGAGPGALGTTGIVVNSAANNFSLINSVLDGSGDVGMIVGPVTGLNVGTNLIEGYSTGMYVSGGGTTGSIHDNRFQGDGAGSGTGLVDGLNSETTHVTISDNIFDGIDGGSLFLFPSGPDSVDLDSYISGNTITDSGADRPVQILPTNLTHNVIGTDYNEAFDGETAALAGVTGSFSFDGQGGDDHAWGGQAGDTLTGGSGADILYGEGGNDTLSGGSGNDSLNGNLGGAGDPGIDTATYAGPRAEYTIVTTTDSNGVVTGFSSVADNNPTGLDEGTDTLTSIERLQFADVTLDLGQRVQLFDGSNNLVGTFNDIQAAIDAAANGYRIEAQAGTYNESLNVDVDVTIEGANAGTAGTGSRGAETVITGNVTIAAAGVTIDGVEITGAAADALGTTGVVVQGGANNFSLVNSVLNGTGDLGMIVGLVTGLDVGDNLIEGYSNGIYVAGGSTTGSVHDNSFLGDGQTNGTGLINGLLSETTHVTISGNAFDALDGGSLFLFPSGPDTVDLDSYISGNTITNSGADRPVQIVPTNLTHNVIGTDYNEAFDGETAALAGVTGAFSFDGQGGDDRAWGGQAGDTFTGGEGDEFLFGNGGTDTAVYAGNRSDYTIVFTTNGNGVITGFTSVNDNVTGNGDEGFDTLDSIEALRFADVTFDLSQPVQLFDGGGNLVGTFSTIQAAIDAASNSYTIRAAAGTYAENLTVDVDVTIEGANVGIAGTGSRGAETVITGNVTIAAAGVTIDGVEITGAAADALGTTGVVVQGGANNFSLVNSVLNGTGDLGMIVGLVTGLDVGDNLIEGYSNGIYVAGGSTTGSVHDNSFLGDGQTNGTGLINGLLSETTHVTISGNAFDALDGGSLFLFPSGPDTVDLDSYISGNTITNSGPDRPVQIVPTNLTHNVIGTDYNEAFDGETAALAGVTGSFTFDGQGGDDRAWGAGEIDTFTGGAGDDWLFGNAGDDNAIYSGNRSDYTVILLSPGVIQITDDRPGSPDGTDRLEGVERVVFANNDYWVEANGTLSVINDAPLGIDHSFTILEDEVRTLTVADFSFTETDPTEANQLLEVTIVDLPTAGTIYYDADGAGGSDPVAISAGDTFTAADLNAGLLTYVPDLNENGPGYASFTYQVRDDGGTAHGGFDTDPVPNTITIDVTPVNDEPTVTATPANPIYVEDAAAVDLFSTVAVSTVEIGQTLTSLTLTVTNVTDGSAEILSFDGSDIALTDGNAVTTATNGLSVSVSLSGTTATVSFSGASLSEAQVAALVDGLSYRNTSQDPTDADRVVTITQLVDSGPSTAPDDNVSAPGLSSTVDVRPVNDEPTLTATGTNPTYVEDATGVDLFSGIAVSTIEAGQTITGLTLTVTNVTDGAFELMRIDGTGVALTDGNSFLTDDNNIQCDVTVVGTTATVVLSGASLTAAQAQTLIDALTYRNLSQGPTDADRVVTITQLVDSGAGTAPDDNVATFNLSSTVNVDSVNDAPTSTLLANDTRTYFEGGAPATLDVLGNATIADVDSANFNGGSLTLSVASALAEDNLVIINGAIVTTAGNVVSVNGTAIGTFSGGTGGTPLTFAFNTDATPAAVQQLVHAIGYSNSGGDNPTGGLRTINWTLDDGDGNANGGTPTLSLSTKVNVIPVNDAPDSADKTVDIDEDQTYHFTASDFAFSDVDGNTLAAVRIDSLPTSGTLFFDPDGAGSNPPFAVSPGVSFSIGSIDNLFYVPDPDSNGLDSFLFAVVDSGGAADATPNTFTFDVAAVNDGPSVTVTPPGGGFETDEQVAIDLQGRIAIDDVDSDGGTITVTLAVDYGIIDVDAGTSGAGVAGSGTDEVTITGTLAQIQALLAGGTGSVTYTPDTDTPPASAELTVTIDDGGNTGGGALTDSDSATIVIDAINDTPLGTDNSVTTLEDTDRTLTAADFTYSDAEGDDLLSVTIVALPANGTLLLNGVPITSSDTVVTRAQLDANQLVFRPDPDANGDDQLTFRVQDDGGTGNGAIDTDPVPNTLTLSVTAVNDEPTLTATAADPTYVEDAAAADLFSTVTVSTVEAGQTITSLTLTVTNVTDGADEILSFDGSDVALTDGNSVLTTTNGLTVEVSVTGSTATVTFSGATLSEAQTAALIDALAYRNASQDPTDGDRVVTVTELVDSGAGGAPDDNTAAPNLASTVDVVPVNDEPTLTATAADPTYVEDAAAADLFSTVTVSTVEAGQTITSLTLTVTNVTDGADEILSFDGSDVALTDGNSVLTTTNGLTVEVSVTGSTATVTFSGATLSEAQAAALIDALAYRNASQDPTDADRVVTVTELVDSGAGGAPDDNTAAPNLASTVDVDPVNDVAIITGDTSGDVTEAGGVNNGTPGTPTDSGDLDAADPDNTNDGWQAVAAGAATTGGYGTYGLSASGVWTYTLDNGNAAVQALNGAATLTDTFTALTEEGTAQLVTITIHAQDDTPVARPDAVTTDEATIVNGNVTANNGSGADSDVDGPALAVAAVNGSGANVGTQITLASGAKLTVNANGTFSYDPNHAFDNTPAPGSGASNQPAHDSFTYTLAGGATATVSLTITGIDTNDLLIGTAAADVLLGGVGNDQLQGLGGDDFLDGGAAGDAMAGGLGNDTYIIDDLTDAVIEASGGGVDTVFTQSGFTLAAGQEVEYLSAISQADTAQILLVGNEFGQFLYGNAGANYLDGGSGNDTLVGFGGDDSYVVDDVGDYVAEVAGGGNDVVYVRGSFSLGADQEVEILAALSQAGTAPIVIIGNNVNQILYGNAGANYLDGGGGNDTLVGFGGDDSYLVDDVNDYVAEVAGGGNDIVYVRGSFSLGADQEVEILAALSQAGTAPIVIVGNGIDQRLFGNNGDNYLDGGGGTDILQGFSGNDTYVVDSLGDYVVEGAGQGSDVVYARSSYALVAGQEIEVLAAISTASTTAMNLTGNEFGNAVYGNNGANILNGGAGGDYLQGFGGADTFQFTTALGGGNVDQIADFVSGTDKIALDDAVFTQLGLGALPASVFATGTAATNEDQRIIYDSATGNLYYDADGNGGGAAVLFATLVGHPPLAASDFLVI